MRLSLLTVSLLALAGCAFDEGLASRDCARTPGCVSSLPSPAYGPIHAQAAAPGTVSPVQPQP